MNSDDRKDRRKRSGEELLDRIARAFADQSDGGDANSRVDLVGERFGNYRLLERLGRGGMGDVYRAERADGAYTAQVAIKVLRASLDVEITARRFHREREILARLSHPNIARLLGGGTGPLGMPFLVMEWIDGVSITDHAQAQGLDLNWRLDLFDQVCAALAYAHRNLVIHRDLKPSNVLVTREGQVKLLDFGIGKLIAENLDDTDRALTRTGLVPMTPAYAAPEQILGESVSTATDVYALGVVLYELLTGELPHARDQSTAATLARSLDGEVVTRPSDCVRRSGHSIAQRRMARHLRGDLDTIVVTALRREPERRYPSAEALRSDLHCHRSGLPIQARADSMGYRAGRFIHRHRFGLAATALIILALVGGLVAALWQADAALRAQHEAERQASLALAQARRAERVRDYLVELFVQNDPLMRHGTEARSPEELLADAALRIEREFGDDPVLMADLLDELGQIHINASRLDQAEPLVRRAFEIRKSELGPDSSPYAVSLVSLSGLALRRGDLDETYRMLRDAERIFRANEGRDSWDLSNVLGGIAQVKTFRRQDEEGLALLRESYDIALRVRGESDVETAMRLNNLAVGLVNAGQYEQALAAASEASRRLEAVLGPEHPRLAFTYLTTGNALRWLDRDAEALPNYRQAAAIAREHFGDHHMVSARATFDHGRLSLHLGALDEAESSLLIAREAAAAASPLMESEVTQALGELALARGDPEQALTWFRQTETLAGERLGAGHLYHWRARLYAQLALAKAGRGNLEEAREVLAELHAGHAEKVDELAQMEQVMARIELASSAGLSEPDAVVDALNGP